MQKKLEFYNPIELFRCGAKDRIAVLALIIFLCSEAINIVIVTLLPASLKETRLSGWLITGVLGGLLIAYYILYLKNERGTKLIVWPLYVLAAAFILFSVLFHREYSTWLYHKKYGIVDNFLMLNCGIFGLLFFSLINDKKRLLGTVVTASTLNFLFYVAQFINAKRRGYWTGINGAGQEVQLSYNLNFGYWVLVPAVVALLLLLFSKHKIISFTVLLASAYMILDSGSRGTLLCLGAAAVIALIYWLRSYPRGTAAKTAIGIIAVTGAVLLIAVLVLGPLFIDASQISNRTLRMLLSGQISDSNGRDRLWETSRGMIADGGLLGYGFYGDRNELGKIISYGYPHNIVLEMLIEFGPIFGTLILALLAVLIIKMMVNCRDMTWNALLILTLSCSVKLFMSDSFWYYWAFWAMLGVIFMWRKQEKAAEYILMPGRSPGHSPGRSPERSFGSPAGVAQNTALETEQINGGIGQ